MYSAFHVSQVRFLLRKHCFLVFAHLGKHGETLAGNNVSATMFPSLPRALIGWVLMDVNEWMSYENVKFKVYVYSGHS